MMQLTQIKKARLLAWAAANGDELDLENYVLLTPEASRFTENSSNSLPSTLIIGALGLTLLVGAYFVFKKKKIA